MLRPIYKVSVILGIVSACLAIGAVTQAQESNLSEVHVQAGPWGATIAVDGRVVNTVEKLWLKPGVYTIHVSLPGFEDWEEKSRDLWASSMDRCARLNLAWI